MIEKTGYHPWHNCYRLQHGEIEAVLLAELGPRVIHFGFRAGVNHFSVLEGNRSLDLDRWQPLGGHRLWLAPEDLQRTYLPDNEPVAVKQVDRSLHAIPPVHPASGIQKELTLSPGSTPNCLQVAHRLTNLSAQPQQLAPWALSIMAPGGIAILPLPPRLPHHGNIRPVNSLALWPYTDLSDSRFQFGRNCVLVRHLPGEGLPQKIGLFYPQGWLAYWQAGELFVKTQPGQAGNYPDLNSNLEIYFDANFLELETLAPLVNLAPGASVEHLERWLILKDVPAPLSPEIVSRQIIPLVSSTLQTLT